ncbi:MAG: hypothetical protein VKK04_11830 [Synechococcales bacterium]|nr:hypothetical protein [Synechococcales bacterium]
MLIPRLQKWLTTPVKTATDPRVIFWFSLSLAIATTYALAALREAFSSPYVVQDDARQYVFWMRRFFDPSLFPNDRIADYFQSVSPVGYVTLYRLAAVVGIDPLVFNKLLPLGLSLVTVGCFFGLTMTLLPVPFAGFAASVLLAQTMWMKDDVISASPRSFVYPFFVAFLYVLARHGAHGEGQAPGHSVGRSLLPGLVILALLGLFYPQYVLVAAAMLLLSLVQWRGGRLRLSQRAWDYWFCASHLAVILAVLLYYALATSEFDPVVTAAQARTMPEFWPGGRSFFFNENPWWFYLVGDRSGIFHVGLLRPATLCLGLALPVMLRSPRRFPLAQSVTPQIGLLLRLLVASLGMWGLAHLLLFRLHLPSRYLDHSWRFIMAIAAAIVLTLALDALWRWSPLGGKGRSLLAWGMAGLIAALLLVYPVFAKDFPLTKYKQGHAPQMYAFLAEQPADIRVASVVDEVNNIPTFSRRSILIGREYAIPYHVGYYEEFRERAIALIRAQYTTDLAELQQFIRTYDIDYWVLARNAYTPGYVADIWINQYLPEVIETVAPVEQGAIAALASLPRRCSVLQEAGLTLIDAQCVLDQRPRGREDLAGGAGGSDRLSS